jgi:hypothetical protein
MKRQSRFVVMLGCFMFWFVSVAHAQIIGIAKLTPSDADQDYGWSFGRSVAIGGDYIVVGADRDRTLGIGAGAAYVFHRVGTSWVQQAKLLALDGAPEDEFGWSVDIDDDRIVVGAPQSSPYVSGPGAAYVYRRHNCEPLRDPPDDCWVEEAKLTAVGPPVMRSLGISVALSGDRVLLGTVEDELAVGRAVMFRREGSAWFQETILVGLDTQAGHRFGSHVALQRDVAVVTGAPEHVGAAYIFRRNKSGWSQGATIRRPEGVGAPSISLPFLVLGAPGLPGAYAFRLDGEKWQPAGILKTEHPRYGEGLGTVVASGLNLATLGAPLDDIAGSAAGSALVFRRLGDTWMPIAELVAPDANEGDQFGQSVALDRHTVVIGAGDAAYVVTLRKLGLSLREFSVLQTCFGLDTGIFRSCEPCDVVKDKTIDLGDYRSLLAGPDDP